MVMENNTIQKARDVLAKWRAQAIDVAWTSTIPLLRGTAGNPDLLDAIEWGLDMYEDVDVALPWVERIAAAIIAANERMQ